MKPKSVLFLCVLLIWPEVTRATCTYDYGADEYVTIANGISPNHKYAITAHGETVDGGWLGDHNFHIYLTDAVTGKKIGPLEEVVEALDTCASSFCAQWSDDSQNVTIIYSVSRHAPHKVVHYRIGLHRAFPLKGPVDATDEQTGYWENQCEVPQPSVRIFGAGKSKNSPTEQRGLLPEPSTSTVTQYDSSKTDDLNTEVSPDHSLRIEQVNDAVGVTDGYPTSTTSWVISNRTGMREVLPTKEDEAGIGRGNPTVAFSEYSFSPDNRWIFRAQKFYHGMCGAYLYKRASGPHYVKATAQPLDILAWQFFHTKNGGEIATFWESGVVRFVAWGPHSLRISLNASKRLTFGDVNDWVVEYDLRSGTFSVPADAVAHNRQAFDASKQ